MPSSDARAELEAELEKAVKAAMKRRAELKAEADRIDKKAEADFWRTIAALRRSYHGAQTDIAHLTGFTRDHIAKRSALHAGPEEGTTGDHS
ncbi:hypothetical protein ACFXJ6_31750 [Streptomyces sp. NPDC059218]|uniref:hypothetical protein n=1 Tax=unclassified Streptomyces TaxID=2593676 RepID=UPI00369ABA99